MLSLCTADISCSPGDDRSVTFFGVMRGGLRCTTRKRATTRIVCRHTSTDRPFVKLGDFSNSFPMLGSVDVTGGCLGSRRLGVLGGVMSKCFSFTRVRTVHRGPVRVRSCIRRLSGILGAASRGILRKTKAVDRTRTVRGTARRCQGCRIRGLSPIRRRCLRDVGGVRDAMGGGDGGWFSWGEFLRINGGADLSGSRCIRAIYLLSEGWGRMLGDDMFPDFLWN